MEEYEIALEDNGQISYSAGKIVLKNRSTGELVAAAYDDKNTHVLLTLCAENQNKVGQIPLNPFKTEKEMWAYIAHEYSRKQNTYSTPEQLEEQFKNIIKRTTNTLVFSKIEIPRESVGSFHRPLLWDNRRRELADVSATNAIRTRRKLIAEQIFNRLLQNSENRFRIRLAAKEQRHNDMMQKLCSLQNALENRL